MHQFIKKNVIWVKVTFFGGVLCNEELRCYSIWTQKLAINGMKASSGDTLNEKGFQNIATTSAYHSRNLVDGNLIPREIRDVESTRLSIILSISSYWLHVNSTSDPMPPPSRYIRRTRASIVSRNIGWMRSQSLFKIIEKILHLQWIFDTDVAFTCNPWVRLNFYELNASQGNITFGTWLKSRAVTLAQA